MSSTSKWSGRAAVTFLMHLERGHNEMARAYPLQTYSTIYYTSHEMKQFFLSYPWESKRQSSLVAPRRRKLCFFNKSKKHFFLYDNYDSKYCFPFEAHKKFTQLLQRTYKIPLTAQFRCSLTLHRNC